jgi:hypothetical protein
MVLQLIVPVNIVHNSRIISTMEMEAIHFSESSVIKRAIRRHISEDDILHSHRRENLKFYMTYSGFANGVSRLRQSVSRVISEAE